jgi:predicted DNA-binding protein with PD1-like motif
MPAIPLSRRQWLGASALGCGCMLASSAGFAEGAAVRAPPGYTPAEGVTDLSKAPGLRSKLVEGGEGQTRSYAVTLGKGDEIMSGMTAFARHERLQAAHFTAIGAIERGLFGWFDKEVKAYRNLPVNDQAEVASLVGDIGLVNGAPAVHIHAVIVLEDGTARGGHLLQANVWPTLEVFLTDYPAPLLKELDAATDLYLFHPEARG